MYLSPFLLSPFLLCQQILSIRPTVALGTLSADRLASPSRTLLERIAECAVADRPGHIESRVLKRRRHYPLLTWPRAVFRTETPIMS